MSFYYSDMEKGVRHKRIIEFFQKQGGYARSMDFKAAHFRPTEINELVQEGVLDKIKAGLYRLSDIEFPDALAMSFVDVSKALKNGVICLISALVHHELSSFNPASVYVAVPNEKYAAKIIYPPVDIFYFRRRFYESGIEILQTKYGEVKIYNKEKTVCDMFRYRNKLGEDLAFEGLRNYVGSKGADINRLMQYAEICRVKLVLAPYLKAILG